MPYDRATAVAYAQKHANAYNREYESFPSDCTNFVSQALLAGGWKMVGGSLIDYKSDLVWWYDKSAFVKSCSYTWAGAHNFSKFMRHSKRGVWLTDPFKLRPGDVFQVAHANGHVWHTTIVTALDSQGPCLSYHTADRLDYPLAKFLTMVAADDITMPWKIIDRAD